ncbi:hypothetical protein C7T35_21380 [Variovorax sp. WS11]|uniref:MAPEG family protein n=1 Tax=Variovorax sp. WS11 TaxID=1105204 RepID=UPI000D0E1BDD|nr:MAPEG family protein [Variovorax sp. WS11]NDZ18784.1 hypothetical protein [Variovorax sp. WS11]PSL82560.1 hypothetical protein C7T35_21380 [Variovorax sp. WS11]
MTAIELGQPLRRHTSAQGNFVEYGPLALIGMGLVEVHAAPTWMILAMVGILSLGRLLHAMGVLRGSAPLGGLGMILTYVALASAALRLVLGIRYQ